MGRGRVQSNPNVDSLIKETKEVSQEVTLNSLDERLENIEVLLKVLILHAEKITDEDFTEIDLGVYHG